MTCDTSDFFRLSLSRPRPSFCSMRCRSLDTQPVPFPPGTAVVVLDTSTRRRLADSAYNERRIQCEATAKFFQVPALRDVTIEQLRQSADALDPVTQRRVRHVVTENDRTLQATEAMRRGDTVGLGCLMTKSHESLRDDFEVSSESLNAMVDCALTHPACYGARMTGAGFGGCAVALIRTEAAADFASRVFAAYQQRTGNTPAVYICRATNGAEVI